MPAIVALLRGVNLGGHKLISMAVLKDLCTTLGHKEVCTHLNSGNIIFKSAKAASGGAKPKRNSTDLAAGSESVLRESLKSRSANLPQIGARIEAAIEKSAGFHAAVILRTTAGLRQAIAQCPFAQRTGLEPSKLAVVFLDREPSPAARDKVNALDTSPDELKAIGTELYIYFPDGQGRSKLQLARIEKILEATGTARNWNTTTKLLEIAERLDAP